MLRLSVNVGVKRQRVNANDCRHEQLMFYVVFISYLNKTYKQDNFYKIVIFTFTTQRLLLVNNDLKSRVRNKTIVKKKSL